MCGGSAPSGETKYNWNDDMAPRWNNALNQASWAVFDGAGNLKPREQYTGQRYAPLAYDQMAAASNIRDLNDRSTGTLQAGNAARGAITNILGGGNTNPYATQNTSTERNLFAGANPYFRDTMLSGMEDITNAYERGTAADTKSMFAQAGAFGGSAHQNAVANNQAALGKNLSTYAQGMLNDQYNRSAGLEDSFLGRDLQNQQYNKSGAMGAFDSDMARRMQAIGYGQNEQGLALDRANAQMGAGQMFQGQDQKNFDFDYEQWLGQQNHPYTQLDWLSNMFGRAQGGGGMNSKIYEGGGSQAAPWLGAALGAYSMFGK